LVPLTFDASLWAPFVPLAGASLPVQVATGSGKAAGRFDEDLLFTHRGLSGPAVLQISSFWQPGQPLRLNLLPGRRHAPQHLRQAKAGSRRQLGNALAGLLPQRLADAWLARLGWAWTPPARCPTVRDKDLQRLADSLARWEITPTGTEGWRKAEVTAGGVDTRELDSRSMASQRQPGLFFIGEVVDVTGWLGGYNFQWAWASAHACASLLTWLCAASSAPLKNWAC
jgi:predicted Rossmann fold flavoprotein